MFRHSFTIYVWNIRIEFVSKGGEYFWISSDPKNCVENIKERYFSISCEGRWGLSSIHLWIQMWDLENGKMIEKSLSQISPLTSQFSWNISEWHILETKVKSRILWKPSAFPQKLFVELICILFHLDTYKTCREPVSIKHSLCGETQMWDKIFQVHKYFFLVESFEIFIYLCISQNINIRPQDINILLQDLWQIWADFKA